MGNCLSRIVISRRHFRKKKSLIDFTLKYKLRGIKNGQITKNGLRHGISLNEILPVRTTFSLPFRKKCTGFVSFEKAGPSGMRCALRLTGCRGHHAPLVALQPRPSIAVVCQAFGRAASAPKENANSGAHRGTHIFQERVERGAALAVNRKRIEMAITK